MLGVRSFRFAGGNERGAAEEPAAKPQRAGTHRLLPRLLGTRAQHGNWNAMFTRLISVRALWGQAQIEFAMFIHAWLRCCRCRRGISSSTIPMASTRLKPPTRTTFILATETTTKPVHYPAVSETFSLVIGHWSVSRSSEVQTTLRYS